MTRSFSSDCLNPGPAALNNGALLVNYWDTRDSFLGLGHQHGVPWCCPLHQTILLFSENCHHDCKKHSSCNFISQYYEFGRKLSATDCEEDTTARVPLTGESQEVGLESDEAIAEGGEGGNKTGAGRTGVGCVVLSTLFNKPDGHTTQQW